jgi:hypothetical protein
MKELFAGPNPPAYLKDQVLHGAGGRLWIDDNGSIIEGHHNFAQSLLAASSKQVTLEVIVKFFAN